jgi:uncharacterized protein (TIGR00251 family)
MNLPIHNNILRVKVIPNASKTEIREITTDIVKIAVAAPPDKNKANLELIKFFKKEHNLNVKIKSGATSRNKTLEI